MQTGYGGLSLTIRVQSYQGSQFSGLSGCRRADRGIAVVIVAQLHAVIVSD
jgi:hypothetical protein